ncbi:MAG: type II toxin-antitoxin system VapC family toxin, partial [Rhodoferax sp.]|nr:type II toxin-antitoxin system VapC family toxin [Rhodoferax sp.]
MSDSAAVLTYVLDASAVIAFVRDEPGAAVV